MKLKLNKRQVTMLLYTRELRGDETKANRTLNQLVAYGFYRDTGDQIPYFVQTNKGAEVSGYLFCLQEMGLLS